MANKADSNKTSKTTSILVIIRILYVTYDLQVCNTSSAIWFCDDNHVDFYSHFLLYISREGIQKFML